MLTDSLDWTDLEIHAEAIRASELKSAAGRPPHIRVLLGAMLLRATRYMPLRELADPIRYYAPARYLCGLTLHMPELYSIVRGKVGKTVEGCIGTAKHHEYGFDRPAVRSAEMMGACGQMAVLGLNLNKRVRELAARVEAPLVG